MSRTYQIVDRPDSHDTVDVDKLAALLAKDGPLLLPFPWTVAAFDAASRGFRRIRGHKDLWMLKASLDERDRD